MATINISFTAAFDQEDVYTAALSLDVFEEDLKEAIESALSSLDIVDISFKHIDIEGLE
jgi:hypothetical protein